MKNTKIVGNAGEDRAAEFYKKNGFEIVERNFRTRQGEIDIIAAKGETLVFAEVKTLPNGDAETLERELGKIKQHRIIESAKFFLKNNRKYTNSIVRFDAVVIDMPGFEPVHLIERAFSEN